MAKIEYRIQPLYGGQANDLMIKLDKQRRAKTEKAAGKPFTDTEWFKYKLMTMPKSSKK